MRMLVAERGRLLERVAAWNETAARDFAPARREGASMWSRRCAEGHDDEARELRGLDVEGYVTTAPGLAARLPAEIAGLVLMAADTTALAEGRRLEAREPQLRSHLEAVAAGGATHGAIAANVAFVVAHSTAGLHPEGYEAGFATERAWQLERLVERLRLRLRLVSGHPASLPRPPGDLRSVEGRPERSCQAAGRCGGMVRSEPSVCVFQASPTCTIASTTG